MKTARVKVRVKEIKPAFWAWMMAHGHMPVLPPTPTVFRMPDPDPWWTNWPYEVTSMERLGSDFEKVWDDNVSKLYQS